ncbi:MAG: PDZ domain-containing protein [Dehalococcoidia bacterium]
MNYIQRNLLPLTVGMLAVVAIFVGVGSLVMRWQTPDEITDEQFERELGRRLDGAMRAGNATLGVQLDADLKVTGVLPEGPGAAAGMQVGDQLLAVNDVDVHTIDEARTRLAAVAPHTEFTVTVGREGARVNLKAVKGAAMTDLGALFQRFTERGPFGRGGPPAPAAPSGTPGTPGAPTQGPVLGVSLQPAPGGLKVLAVTPNSPAAGAGLQPDDVIVTANGRATGSVEGLQAILRDAGPGSSVSLAVKRGDQQLTLTATLGPRT